MIDIFSELNFPPDSEVQLSDKVLTVKKWSWDFLECEKFQQEAQKIIQKNRDYRVYIFTNHPHCFTLGRGNERGVDSLVAFDESITNNIKYPLHKIHRGGGVTFHYPGQWIFYPIVALKESFSLEDISCWLLKNVKNSLLEMGVEEVITATKLMGVWRKKQKLASIGIGVSRFVTIHGIALNVINDKNMFDELQKINPCGINPETYVCVDAVMSKQAVQENLIEDFHKYFTAKL